MVEKVLVCLQYFLRGHWGNEVAKVYRYYSILPTTQAFFPTRDLFLVCYDVPSDRKTRHKSCAALAGRLG
jgi:hypothetical protein